MISILLSFTGCMIGSTGRMKQKNIEEKIINSPYIVDISKEKYEYRTNSEEIEFFYHTWNSLTKPGNIRNWKYYFVIEEGSKPTWKYTVIARVDIFQKSRDDYSAMKKFRSFASQKGGDAVIDLYREPAINSFGFPAGIIGYRYSGKVVRKK